MDDDAAELLDLIAQAEQELEALDTEATRSRRFIRAAETQLSKVLAQAALLEDTMTRLGGVARSVAAAGGRQPNLVGLSPSEGDGAGGTSVTITLTNGAESVDSVTIGGSSATIVSKTTTTVVVTTPSGTAGVQPVVVKIGDRVLRKTSGEGLSFTYTSSGSPATTINLTADRLAGSGSVVVSSGVPLQEGELVAADIGDVALWLNTGGGLTEVSCYVEVLGWKWPDGSVRFLLVQWTGDPDSVTAAELRLGTAAVQSRLSKSTIDFTGYALSAVESNGFPDAIWTPTVAHMVACQIGGHPTISSAAATALGTPYSTYESNLDSWGDTRWTNDWVNPSSPSPPGVNQYDRALHHFVQWARTGESKWFLRACSYAVGLREHYFVPSGSAPRYFETFGQALHYCLTGDVASRDIIKTVPQSAPALWYTEMGKWRDSAWNGTTYCELRPMAYWLRAYALAHLLEIGGTFSHSGKSWLETVQDALDKIMLAQESSGSSKGALITDPANSADRYQAWVWEGAPGDPSVIHVSNFYQPLMLEALAFIYDHVDADARIPPLIKNVLDYLWDHQWRSGDATPSFNYYDVSVSGHGGPTAATDLTGLYAGIFTWYYNHSGTSAYLTRAEAVFAEVPAGATYTGAKQFNQAFRNGWKHYGYR